MPSGAPGVAAGLPASTQVIVAGGGPVGLAAAIELGGRGIRCLVIEPRTAVSHARPRCKTINVRSMEHLRRWGIADRLRELAPLTPSWSQDVVFCTSLAGRELSRFTGVLGLVHDGDRFPELGQQAPQYVLEELLREVGVSSPRARW
jgi:2-polyprenyl-6-methoxyphenol hydroxylase-like FAD-dependent oxidoreductase